MAICDPTDTLAFHKSRPLCVTVDNSSVPLPNLTNMMKGYMQSPVHVKARPESEALFFYGLNHVVAEIAQRRANFEPLDTFEHGMLDAYHLCCGDFAVRAFYYLIWICTREARHCHNVSSHVGNLNAIGVGLGNFYTSINGGESGISSKLIAFPPACTVGQYVESLCHLFKKGSWGGSFGGHKWWVIADVARKFVKGEFSAEMMLDTLFTLQHNSCSIFNKGEFYHNFTPTLERILDVQRSGQIPHAVLGDQAMAHFVTPELANLMKAARSHYPDKIKPEVDWYLVEALGALGSYHSEKAKQVLTPAQKQAIQDKLDAKQAAAFAAQQKAQQDKIDFEKNHVQIMPKVYVAKVKLERAA